jgi:hypothetical protein
MCKTTQITHNGKKITYYDFTEEKRDAALDKLDRMESMLMSVLMSQTTK